MPNLDWNKEIWSKSFDWTKGGGEEWSEPWGSSYAQWIISIYPRISMFLPSKNILEIATGFGRWTKFLLPLSERFVGVDVTEKCIEQCKEIFSSYSNAGFYLNNGTSLNMCENDSIDFCFSYDSLVHVDLNVISEYVAQILRKLSGDGVAFIHHSNFEEVLCNFGSVENTHFRDKTVSVKKVYDIIESNNGKVLVQEKFNWISNPEYLIDGLTLFCKKDSKAYKNSEYQLLSNPDNSFECSYAKKIISRYIQLDKH